MKKRTIIAVMLVLALCCGLLTGCTSPESDNGSGATAGSETLKVGYIGPLTGSVAQYGVAVRNGVQMYVDEINAAGGVLGKQVELVALDDTGDAMEALNVFTRLVEQEKVVAIFGAVTSAPTAAIAQESATMANPIPMITASGTAEEITLFGDNMFRSCFIDPFQGEVMARYAKEILGAESVAVIFNNSSDYSTGLRDSFVAKCAELGVAVVAEESYGANTVDFKAQLTNIQAKNPDVLFVPDYYTEAAYITSQAAEIGFDVPKLGGDGWDGVVEASTNPASLNNCYFSNHAASDDPDIMAFAESYTAKFNVAPLSFSATAYDSAKIMFDAIERAGSTDSAAIIAALQSTNLACLTGTFTFDENNNPIKDAAIIKIVDGQYVFDQKF